MPRNFTDAERLVATAVSANPTDTANDNDVEAGGYMRPIADAILPFLDDDFETLLAGQMALFPR